MARAVVATPRELTSEMELFRHEEGSEDPEVIEVEATATVRELLAASDADGRIWIEEVEQEVELDVTLEAAGFRHRHHFHRGRCRHVKAVIRYNGVAMERSFTPNATIKKVYKWGSGPDGFKLSPAQAAKHVLAVPHADHFLADTVHIGSLLAAGSCEVILDLLPRERFEG